MSDWDWPELAPCVCGWHVVNVHPAKLRPEGNYEAQCAGCGRAAIGGSPEEAAVAWSAMQDEAKRTAKHIKEVMLEAVRKYRAAATEEPAPGERSASK